MVMVRKRVSSTAPKKAQAEITSFTSKRIDNKNSPRRSYVQAVSENPYEVLSGPDDDDVDMHDAETCDSSDATPKNRLRTSVSSPRWYYFGKLSTTQVKEDAA